MKTFLQIPIVIKQLKVTGPIASREVDMIFDTGARYTSFSWDTLKDITINFKKGVLEIT